ncbi:MAG: sigma-70 family RNA polymerase sigma factor [Planctomycetales bacterium]|nr:sigma-70 family RNA polymerase sigma factor [Planctomycetales bacterium]MBN8628088.1 sigma-70 family RNA polymerase sigma factor [Planctomycetota bacterium]
MVSGQPLAALLQKVSFGDDSAAEMLLQQFGPVVLRTVRLRLNEKLRRKLESVDLVQAVWQSFFGNFEELGHFDDPNKLCAYLVRIAERKVFMAARYENRAKRGGGRLQQLDEVIADSSKMFGRESTPSKLAVAAETWEQMIAKLSARDQRILYLRNLGFTRVEIAEQLSIGEATVRRVLDSLKATLGLEK